MFRKLGFLCPIFGQLQGLFPESAGLREALTEFYAITITFCAGALKVIKGRSEFFFFPFSVPGANERLLKVLNNLPS